ncbi:MAG: hypothetical protein KH301_04945 [Brachyspira sp.]|nr:hypothetical protein [Brachyspira sp.]
MKKFLISLGIVTITALAANARCDETFICPSEMHLSGRFSRGLSAITGSNFLATKTVESILKNQIKKEAKGNFDVNLQSYSLPDLKAGRFKSLEITGENVVADNIYLSRLTLKTLCDYNYISYNAKNKTAIFKEDFGMAFSTSITEEDLNNTMNSNGYKELIAEINSIGKNYNLFKISEAKAEFKDNKFLYVFKVVIPILNLKQNIVISSDINVSNGRLYLYNTKIINDIFSVDLSQMSYIMNHLNPLNFSLNVLKNKYGTLTVKNAVIKDNRIDIDGTIIVLKDMVTQNKE